MRLLIAVSLAPALALVAGPAAAETPVIASVVPASSLAFPPPTTTVAPATFFLAINGSGFVSGSTILLNSQPQSTAFLFEQLMAQIPLSAADSGGGPIAVPLTVVNPGGDSATTTLHLLDLSPPTVLTGGPSTVILTASSPFFEAAPTAVTVGDSTPTTGFVMLSQTVAQVTIPAGALGSSRRLLVFASVADRAGVALLDVREAMPTLTITRAGGGAGTVVSSAGGIDCGGGGACAADIVNGTQVAITAEAAAGSSFGRWFGGGCGDANPCVLTLTEDTRVSAVFVPAATPTVAGPIFAAVLPSSRSVQVGHTATAFATILNPGSLPATGCGVALATPLPGTLDFSSTDPATNAATGDRNVPIDIPAGGAATFIVFLSPTAAIDSQDVAFTFDCANSAPAASMTGINTLLFSASLPAIPDVVALAATLSGDGIVNVQGPAGAGAFAVATVNVGFSGTVTASADTGGVPVPIALALCRTDQATGQCLSGIGPAVTTSIDFLGTPTFGIFVQGLGVVPFDPARNRIFVRFRDASGVTRGSTSVAVRTP